MNTTHQGVVTLLRSGVTGEKLPLPEGFSLEEADKLIRSQSLMPIAYQGAFNCGIPGKSEIMRQYQIQYCQSLISSDRQLRAAERIFRAFEDNGIDYMPLKGCNLKKLYPKPELRIMGDADVLIRLEQYHRIKPIMLELGYEEGEESAHDLCWKGPDLYVELHKCLFGPEEADLYGFYGDGWAKARKGGGCRYELSKEDEYIYLFTHMTKHFRFSGIGARHILDLYVYRAANPDLDEGKIRKAMDRLGLLEFYGNIQRLLAQWFGDGEEDDVTAFISQFVFSSGSFGTLENRLYTEGALKSRKRGGVKNSKLRSVVNALFPPLRQMQLAYRILYRYPVLYPAFWVVRWVDILLHRRKNVGKKMRLIRNVTDEKISAHQQAFAFMGLDFDYGEE